MPDLLQEFCSSRGVALRIDRDAGLLRGVKLLGLASKNGREYPETTLARAAALYEGAKVNVNHPKGHPQAPRDYQDRLGTIRNVVARPGEGLFGDLQFNPKHALAEQLVWDAEHAPENVGFSHNVQARTVKRGDQTIVEEILTVQSVDLVADPATTRGLFENEAHAHLPSQIANDVEQQPTASRVGLADSAHPTVRVETACEADHVAEIERLREEVKTLQAAQAIAHKRAAIAALLVEHGLPPLDTPAPSGRELGRGEVGAASAILSESFLQTLFAAPDERVLRNLVRERAALIEQAHHWKCDVATSQTKLRVVDSQLPVSREQTLVESAAADDSLDAFLKAIRA